MLRTNSSGASPLGGVTKLNTSLQHDINHVFTARLMRTNIDAASLPRLIHLVPTVPLIKNHYAVMWLLVQLSHLLQAELDPLVVSALLSVVEVRCR